MNDTRAVLDSRALGGLRRWLAALNPYARQRSRFRRRRPIPAVALQALEPRTLLSATLLSRSPLPGGGSSLDLNGARGQQRISHDGRFIVFSSTAECLGTDDTNGAIEDVFLHDPLAGTTTLLSRNAAGGSGDAASFNPVISADGRFIVFESDAGDLVGGDANGATDLFLFDRLAGTLTLVSGSAGSAGTANGRSFAPVISADGGLVAFASDATNLVAGATDANGTTDLYLFERSTGLVTLVSHVAGNPLSSGAGESYNASISADGNWIAYESAADDLAAGDGNSLYDVFLFDRSDGSNVLVSSGTGTVSGSGHSFNAIVSADGGVVVFESYASDLAGNDTNGSVGDVFLFDRAAGTIELVSRNAAGTGSGNRESWGPIVSADGSVVVFESFASDLTGDTDANAQVDVFLYERGSGAVTLVSKALGELSTGNEASFAPGLSRNGRYVVFASFAGDLISEGEDANETVDVFLLDRLAGGAPGLLSANAAATGSGNGDSWDAQISGDGSYVAFTSGATDLIEPQTGAGLNVFGVHTTPVVWIEGTAVPETNGPTTIEFTVRRSHSGTAAEVQYWTLDGSASAGSDYAPIDPSWLQFAAGGSLSATIAVQVHGDEIVEFDETVHIELLNAIGATIAAQGRSATGTLENDDFGTVEVLDIEQQEGTGGVTEFIFTVTLSHAVQGSVDVTFANANGTARAGEDFQARSGSLHFAAAAPGETQQIKVLVFGDSRVEENETFTLRLTGAGHLNVTANDTATGTILNDDRRTMAVSVDALGGTRVKVFDATTGALQFSVFAYDRSFRGGVRVAMGDVTGDGVADIITAPGAGMAPLVRVFDGQTGAFVREFFAYRPDFDGGVFLAVGDVNRDGRADIITAPGAGGGPKVRAFSGRDGSLLSQFFAYRREFRGGVHVAAGDVNGDGSAEIVTAPSATGGPRVRVFNGQTGGLVRQFFAYPAWFRGGVHVAVGDVVEGGAAEIITGPGQGAPPDVRVFGSTGALLSQFFAYDTNFRGGVRVAAAKVYSDAPAAIITGPGSQMAPIVRAFTAGGVELHGQFAFAPWFGGGTFVAGVAGPAAGTGGLPSTPSHGLIGISNPSTPPGDGQLGTDPVLFDGSLPSSPIGSPLQAANGVPDSGRDVPKLTMDRMGPLQAAAIGRLQMAGIPPEALSALDSLGVNIHDYAGGILSAAATDSIQLDSTAAGYGWFLDATPDDDAEYAWRPTSGWRAVSPHAVRGMDLLSVFVYELSHHLGGIDLDPALDPQHWMARTLQPGRRRVPSDDRLAEVFSEADWFGSL